MKRKSILAVAILSTLLNACAGGIDGNKYVDQQPAFKLEEYFSGDIKAWGMIQDWRGNITTRFDVILNGTWNGNEGVLDETFTYYESGKVQKRVWRITKIDDTNYRGTADDIIGTAQGKAYGNAIYWSYQMDVPVDDTTYRLTFDDWIWSMNDGVIINRSYLKKFGFTVAELTVFMQKQQ